MGTDNAVTPVEGVAAGVPYVALAPTGDRDDAPLVVVWHLMDPRGARRPWRPRPRSPD
jgi:hypothetical protein